MWRHSTEINKNAGNNTSWNTNIVYKVSSKQLRRDTIKVKVVDSGKVIGQGSVTALPLFVNPGKVVKLKCELNNNGEPAGAIVFGARFRGDKAVEDKPKKATAVPSGDHTMSGSGKQQNDQIREV